MVYACTKRFFDIIAGSFGIVLLIPITIVIKLAYLSTGDFHSIFFVQKRIGKNGKEFGILKYRSMVPNADEVLKEILKDKKYREQWEEFQKIENDPRITKIGKFIRKSSLDEFPQFINVLVGQMSIIGPRPLIPGELEHHGARIKDIKKYQSIKPGVTGYWAMRIRSNENSDYAERLKLEYFYIENQGFTLDTKIFFQTIGTVLKQEGAK